MKLWNFIVVLTLIPLLAAVPATAETPKDRPLTVVVMDPLAAPLSCPCVEGYAQRKYEVLASHLQKALGRPVKVVFAEALETALKDEAKHGADLIIGKESVVRADAKTAKIDLTPIARLTGKDGNTTQTGLIVVSKDDPAKSVADLNQYRIFFGPAECEEKHSAALTLLKSVGVSLPKELEIDAACSDGASKVVDAGSAGRTAAVISSYAAPLLEGCGTIKKGDLRVIGETQPVPFITAFTTSSVDRPLRQQLRSSLAATATDPQVLNALESLIGFLPIEPVKTVAAKKK